MRSNKSKISSSAIRKRFEHFKRMDIEAWKVIVQTGELIKKWMERNG